MSVEKIGLLVHLLGAFAFIGGVVTAGAAYETARRRRSAIEVAAVLRVARTGALMAIIGGVALLVGGFWLAGQLDLFRHRWLEASILAFVLSMALGAVAGRRPKKARELATNIASGEGGDPEDLRRLLNDPGSRLLNYVSAVLALAVLVLMIWQPVF